MNNFNPDQNPHILSSPEDPEGGAGGGNVLANQAEQRETELSGEVLEGQEGQPNVEGGEVDSLENALGELVADLGAAETSPEEKGAEIVGSTPEDTLDTLIREEVEASKPKFKVGENGLSLQGSEIQSIQSQIQQLESGQGDLVDSIRAEIAESRQAEIENLEAEKFKLEGEKLDLEQKHTNLINQGYNNLRKEVPNTKVTLKEFSQRAMSTEAFSKEVKANNTAIQSKEEEIKAFDTETQTLIKTAIQNKKTELQQQLTEAQSGYTESGAEANDKKVLLERQLKEQLTDPNQLFSQQNIDQILATYGIKEGLDKLEELQQASDKAREQATHDEIRKDIMSRAYLYNQRPELAEALSTDIQSKLEALRQSNPESDTIKTALSLGGENRLEYLTDSRDSQLQELAFWFANDRTANIDSIVAEHPQFAKYLDKETDRIYTEQQQEIQSGKKYGQKYLGSRMDKARRVEVDNRISTQLERSKNTKVQELQGELASLKFDENGLDYDTQDRAMLSEQEQLRPADIDRFRTELKTALESGQIKFEQGQFSSVENIPEKQQEINKQLETLFNTIQPVLEAAGYPLQSLESLSSIASNIDNNKKEADKKLFGFGKKQAQALESLATEVANTIEKYNTLKADKQKNTEQYDSNSKLTNSLRESYQKLPKSIQNSLSNLENPTLDSINQTINTGVESIQNYQTPPEVASKRQRIESIESEIAETQAITAPQTSTQS